LPIKYVTPSNLIFDYLTLLLRDVLHKYGENLQCVNLLFEINTHIWHGSTSLTFNCFSRAYLLFTKGNFAIEVKLNFGIITACFYYIGIKKIVEPISLSIIVVLCLSRQSPSYIAVFVLLTNYYRFYIIG
jgi:hypothetical protein